MIVNQKALGAKLTEARRKRGLLQKQAAAEMHITTSMLSNIEKGLRMPELPTLVLLAEYYGLSLDYLVGLQHEQAPVNLPSMLGQLVTKYPGVSTAVKDRKITLTIDDGVIYIAPADSQQKKRFDTDADLEISQSLSGFLNACIALADLKKKGAITDSAVNDWLESESRKAEEYRKNPAQNYVRLEGGDQNGTEKEG